MLTLARYVGLVDGEDDFNLVERFHNLKAELEEKMIEEKRLNYPIRVNISRIAGAGNGRE